MSSHLLRQAKDHSRKGKSTSHRHQCRARRHSGFPHRFHQHSVQYSQSHPHRCRQCHLVPIHQSAHLRHQSAHLRHRYLHIHRYLLIHRYLQFFRLASAPTHQSVLTHQSAPHLVSVPIHQSAPRHQSVRHLLLRLRRLDCLEWLSICSPKTSFLYSALGNSEPRRASARSMLTCYQWQHPNSDTGAQPTERQSATRHTSGWNSPECQPWK